MDARSVAIAHGLPLLEHRENKLAPPDRPRQPAYRERRELPGVGLDHIKQAFDEIDFDKRGFVGASELRFLLTACGERPTDAELDEMLQMIGAEESGQASLTEYLKLFGDDTPVLQEMYAMRAPDEELPEDNRKKSGMTTDDFKKLVTGAEGFLGALGVQRKTEQRLSRLPRTQGRLGSKRKTQVRAESPEPQRSGARSFSRPGAAAQRMQAESRVGRTSVDSLDFTQRNSLDWGTTRAAVDLAGPRAHQSPPPKSMGSSDPSSPMT